MDGIEFSVLEDSDAAQFDEVYLGSVDIPHERQLAFIDGWHEKPITLVIIGYTKR